MSICKRMQLWAEKVDKQKIYPAKVALQILKECSTVKFDESVDLACNLGVDAKKSDQGVRGVTMLPKGTGRIVRIAVFAQGEQAEAAKSSGADIVGFDDLVEIMQGGKIDCDVVIATPDAMPIVSKLGKILGPHGLMPNPKTGTVSTDVGQAVRNAKAGQVSYRTDKNGIIHSIIGKISFEIDDLHDNLECLLVDLKKLKPSSAKGVYFKKISLATTMGPGLVIDISHLTI